MSTITRARKTSPPPPPRRITVDEYEWIIESGALEEPGRIELIDGYLVEKMGKKAEHCYATKQTLKALEARLPVGWTTRPEQPVRIPAYDEPEPDVAIIRGSDADYEHRIPTSADVALLVEVSDSTLNLDRGKKLSAYVRERIPIYWIVNLVDRQVEVYSSPAKIRYKSRRIFKPGQQVPVIIGKHSFSLIAADDLLPSKVRK